MQQKFYDKQITDDEESSFEIMEWASYFLHHWYLFVIGIILSLGLAYLENRSWLPSFQTAGTVMIEENRSVGNSSQALMQGFGIESGYKNISNQVIMLRSNDLISKVVDSIPFLNVDYISKGSFNQWYNWVCVFLLNSAVGIRSVKFHSCVEPIHHKLLCQGTKLMPCL